MNTIQKKQLKIMLQHLYINPLERCNLNCKICYTHKTLHILSEEEILSFVSEYKKIMDLKVITFCGGEVFTLSYFTRLVNLLTNQGLFIQIITNGTVDKLSEISNPNLVNLIVSIDGVQKYHDTNRGSGNFNKSIAFLKKAQLMKFHTEIFSIVTQQNYQSVDLFELSMQKKFHQIPITYHPRKPLSYLNNHPHSNYIGVTKNFDFLDFHSTSQLLKSKITFPPKELGCFQISLLSNGTIYGCCEGITPIGKITTPIRQVIDSLIKNVKGPCKGCSYPKFLCGLKKYFYE